MHRHAGTLAHALSNALTVARTRHRVLAHVPRKPPSNTHTHTHNISQARHIVASTLTCFPRLSFSPPHSSAMRASLEDNAGGGGGTLLAWLYVGAHGDKGLRVAACLVDAAAEEHRIRAWASRSDVAQALGLRKVRKGARRGGGACACGRGEEGEGVVCVCVCVPGSSHMLPSASRFRVPVCIERAWSKQCGDGGGGGLRALDA